jgi:hypothetical protein
VIASLENIKSNAQLVMPQLNVTDPTSTSDWNLLLIARNLISTEPGESKNLDIQIHLEELKIPNS